MGTIRFCFDALVAIMALRGMCPLGRAVLA